MVVRADDRAGGAVRLAVAAASARVGPGQAGRRRVGQRAGQAAAGAAAMNGAAHRRQVPLKDKKNRFAFFCRIFIPFIFVDNMCCCGRKRYVFTPPPPPLSGEL